MCTPLMALAAVGTGLQAVGAYSAQKTNQANATAQAKLLDAQAQKEQMSGDYQAAALRKTLGGTLAANRAAYGANGIALTGSAADVLASTAAEGELDVQAIRWNSKVAADNLRYQGAVSRANASAYGMAAPLAFTSTAISGATQIKGWGQ